jgi:hypothetical protein
MKGKSRRKIFQIEMSKELRSKVKKTKKNKQGAPEMEFLRMIEEAQNN